MDAVPLGLWNYTLVVASRSREVLESMLGHLPHFFCFMQNLQNLIHGVNIRGAFLTDILLIDLHWNRNVPCWSTATLKVRMHPLPQIPSKQWLAKQTAGWKASFHLKINVPREEALKIISQDGMLLVLCSYIDNMPYVVAEAAVC